MCVCVCVFKILLSFGQPLNIRIRRYVRATTKVDVGQTSGTGAIITTNVADIATVVATTLTV
eukprot:SAG31_NODE_2345_length_5903_cov_1.552895_4_plen_62_part_00